MTFPESPQPSSPDALAEPRAVVAPPALIRARHPLSHYRPVPSGLPVQAPSRREAGQATAEYALVLLGAAAVALMLAAWAAKSGAIGDLFDAVVGQLIDKAG